MKAEVVKEQNLEKQIHKQMGCMAGFLQIFDRHQSLSVKRLYSAKHLPPSQVVDIASDSDQSAGESAAVSADLETPLQPHDVAAQTPAKPNQPPAAADEAELRPKSPLPLSIFQLKEGNRPSWKFCKEAPRLSLDSRANIDAKGVLHPKEIRTASSILSLPNRGGGVASDATDAGQHHRSPSVVARLMGLEPFPDSSGSEPEKKPELRRSTSESRVSKDLFQFPFAADSSNFYSKQPTQSPSVHFHNAMKGKAPMDAHYADPYNNSLRNANKAVPLKGLNRGCINSTLPRRALPNRKSFFDSEDIFPEPKLDVSIYSEIAKRLKMRGIEEPPKELETLKQIFEAQQLKGLLHPKPPSQHDQLRNRHYVYDESPIVLMKPSGSTPVNRRMGIDYSPSTSRNEARGVRRNYSLARETSPLVSPRREKNIRGPNRGGRSSSPTTRRNEGDASARRSNTMVKPKPLNAETQRRLRANESAENRKSSPVHSPKLGPKTAEPHPTVNNRSPRSKKSTVETPQKEKITTIVIAEEESASISGGSSTDAERWKAEECKEKGGRNLLERCDKLLHSIAEMAAADTQPSPVSVLDPSLYKDESLTPSPITIKRKMDFEDQSGELEEDAWSPVISPIRSKRAEILDDPDFVYVSDILRASHYLPEESNVFQLLEEQQYLEGNDTSKVSRLQRKLIFDTVNEILYRNRQLPPWKAVSWSNATPSLDKIWSEYQRFREHETAEDLFQIINGVLKKDLAGDAISGWVDCPVEMSEAILDMERLIFKDLICESIRDLAAPAPRGTLSSMVPKKRLIF